MKNRKLNLQAIATIRSYCLKCGCPLADVEAEFCALCFGKMSSIYYYEKEGQNRNQSKYKT